MSGDPIHSDVVPQVPILGPGKSARWRSFVGPVIILLAAAVATVPERLHGYSCGHDFDFHLVSWFEAENNWHQGILYPHWAPSPNFGAGEPRFVFYPPLTWMLGAALHRLMGWGWVPAALIFLMLAGTGLATRALARQALEDGAATLAGCAAIFSGYALFTAYERSAFGELTGGFWIPLLLLLILRDRHPAGGLWRRALDGSTLPLALVVAGAWLSNVPLGLMACYLLAAVALAAALMRKSWAPAIRASLGAVLGIGLASIYLVPATFEQRWIDVRQVLDDPGERIESNWMFARHADPALEAHDTVLLKASVIAATMLTVALLGLLITWMRGRNSTRPGWWIPLALIPVIILFLQFPVSLPVWNALPRLRYLQFPWRWLVVLESPMAIFFAAAVWPAKLWRRMAVVLGCTAVFVAATGFANAVFFQYCDPDDSISGMTPVYRSGAGFAGTDEFEPPGAENDLVAMGLPAACLVADPHIELGKASPDSNPAWYPEQQSCEATFAASTHSIEHVQIRATVAHAGTLILRLRSYPAWRVTVNGLPPAAMPRRKDGLMAVPVQQGRVDLDADWNTTGDAIAGRWLSGLAVLLLTALCLLERRLAHPRVS